MALDQSPESLFFVNPFSTIHHNFNMQHFIGSVKQIFSM